MFWEEKNRYSCDIPEKINEWGLSKESYSIKIRKKK